MMGSNKALSKGALATAYAESRLSTDGVADFHQVIHQNYGKSPSKSPWSLEPEYKSNE